MAASEPPPNIPPLPPELPAPPSVPPTPGGGESASDSGASSPDSRWSRLPRGVVLAIGIGMGAAAVGGCWLVVSLAGGGASSRADFATSGTLTLADSSFVVLDDGDPCTGTGGYSDIRMGSQVNVTGADGTLVATGELGRGEKADAGCEFPFTVEGIPQGSKFYTVEVSHRGGLTQTESELRAAGLTFTLGGD